MDPSHPSYGGPRERALRGAARIVRSFPGCVSMPESPPEAPREPVEPVGLSERAAGWWRVCVAEFDLSDAEVELLGEAAWTITEIDGLRRVLERDGLSVLGSTGQPRVHPAVNEIRQHRMALARLVKAIDLPAEDEEPETQTTKDARAAARARWAMTKGQNRGTA